MGDGEGGGGREPVKNLHRAEAILILYQWKGLWT